MKPTADSTRQKQLDEQSVSWSRSAAKYDDLFLDPFRDGVQNPILDEIKGIAHPETKVVADLGCGTGPLLPLLVERFSRVYALDFAEGMLKQARKRLTKDQQTRVVFLNRAMSDLEEFANQWDVVVSYNAIVMPAIEEIDRSLAAIRKALKPGGLFVGILPAMDAIHYHTMLLYDLALAKGMSLEECERYATFYGEHHYYDFAFGRFEFKGLKQKFWQPFEIEHRFRKAGFTDFSLHKVRYPWDDQLVGYQELSQYPCSWDWGFIVRT